MKTILTGLTLLVISTGVSAMPRFDVPMCNDDSHQELYEAKRNRSPSFMLDKRRMPVVNETAANEISRDVNKGRAVCLSIICLSTDDGSKSQMYTHEYQVEWVNSDVHSYDVNITSLRLAPLHY